jgi:hypothetical protein
MRLSASLAWRYSGIKHGQALRSGARRARPGPCQAANPKRNVEDLRFRRRGRVPLAEFIDTAAGIHDFLLAGIERMAVRADLDLKIMPDGRAGLERIPASAGDGNCFVFGVDGGLHVNLGVAVGRIDEPDDA